MDKAKMARVILDLEDASDLLSNLGHPPAHPLTQALRKVNLAVRSLRDDSEDMPTLIRQCAERGLSRHEALSALRISRYRFDLLVSAMPELKWPNGQSVAAKRYNESLKGLPVSPERKAALDRGREIMKANARKYTLCGVNGTLRELCDLWCDYMYVSYSTVTHRIREGWSLYDAMFKRRQPSASTPGHNTPAMREHRAKLKRLEDLRIHGSGPGAARTFDTHVSERARNYHPHRENSI